MHNTNGINGNMFAPAEGIHTGSMGQTQTQDNLFGEIQNLNDQINVASTTRNDTFQKSQSVLVPLQASITQANEKAALLTRQYTTASTLAQTASGNLQTANNVVAAALNAYNSIPEGDEAAKAQALANYQTALANQQPCQQEFDKAMQTLQQIQTEMTNTMDELNNLNMQYAAENTKYTTELAQTDTQINLLQTQLVACQTQLETLKTQAAAQPQEKLSANEMQKQTENGEEFDVQTIYNEDGTHQEVFFQDGVKVKSRNLDAQGRIIRGTHYDANGKETGHYERAFNEDGSFYDKWYDGDKAYTGSVTHRDPAGNILNEITYNAATGEVMQPNTRTRVENGIEYTIETKANQDGTYTETFYQDGVKIKYRNYDARGRITEGVHFDENGNVTGRYGRAYHADGSYTDAWFDGNNAEPSVVTQKDAFGNDKEALQAQADTQFAQTETEAAETQKPAKDTSPINNKQKEGDNVGDGSDNNNASVNLNSAEHSMLFLAGLKGKLKPEDYKAFKNGELIINNGDGTSTKIEDNHGGKMITIRDANNYAIKRVFMTDNDTKIIVQANRQLPNGYEITDKQRYAPNGVISERTIETFDKNNNLVGRTIETYDEQGELLKRKYS